MNSLVNTVLLPTAYIGTVEYFYFLNRYQNVIVEQHETWPKQTYRNRTILITDKGKNLLTVPVNKVNGNHTKTKDIIISYREKWYIRHWRSIETAYRNSPFFLYYKDEIREVLFKNHNKLLQLNEELTKLLCELTGIVSSISYSTKFEKNPAPGIIDLRNKITPKRPPLIQHFPEYIQVFHDKQPFIANAGMLDLLFCLGPESKAYLEQLKPNVI